ncbi:MAG: YdcF family protein [Oscillospiraceae bacterium]|nr:YdcF family protein [Oscillospiraceae bacterium]
MKKNKVLIVPFIALFLVLCALVLKVALAGYSFLSYILVAAAALLIILHLLFKLAKKRGTAGVIAKILIVLILLALAAGIVIFAVNEADVVKNAKTEERAYSMDYVVVLGAGVNGTEPSLSLYNRLEAALDFLEKAPGAVAIVSGGQGPGEMISEAECMRQWLEARGVAPERIIMEPAATNTYENLKFSFDIIAGREGGMPDGVAIVSSEYHLLRAKLQAKKLGVDNCAGVAAKTTLPVLRTNYFMREAFGVAYERFFG